MSFENDITLIKQLVEAEPKRIFKSASPDNLGVRADQAKKEKEAKEAQRLGEKIDFCPHCGVDMRDKEVGITRRCLTRRYDYAGYHPEYGWLNEESDYGDDELDIEYACGSCGELLEGRGRTFDIDRAI